MQERNLGHAAISEAWYYQKYLWTWCDCPIFSVFRQGCNLRFLDKNVANPLWSNVISPPFTKILNVLICTALQS